MSEEGIICSIDWQFTSSADGDDWFVVTRCGHTFHNSCITKWIGTRASKPCPICKQDVAPSELRRLHGINPSKRRTVTGGGGDQGSSMEDVTPNLDDLADSSLSQRDPDYTFKIILLGGQAVGKSSLIKRYTEGVFDFRVTTTVGLLVAFKNVEIGGKLIKLTIWDTGGQERFNAITGNFARNSHGVLLVYSYGNSRVEERSLRAIPEWIEFVKKYGGTASNDTAMLLVGNKVDFAPEERGISSKQGHEFAKKNSLSLFETSALDDLNVEAVFKALVVDILEKIQTKRMEYLSQQQREAEGRLQLVPYSSNNNNVKKKDDSCPC